MSHAQARCNLIRDGIERTATHARQVIKHSRGVMSVIVRPNGSLRAYRRNDIPECDAPYLLGTYTSRISPAVLIEDLTLRLAELEPNRAPSAG